MLNSTNMSLPDKHPSDLSEVVEALNRVQAGSLKGGHILAQVKRELSRSGIEFEEYAKIAPRIRIDILTAGGVGVAVKQGRPNEIKTFPQLIRYAESERVKALVIVSGTYVDLPVWVKDKRVVSLGFRKLYEITSSK